MKFLYILVAAVAAIMIIGSMIYFNPLNTSRPRAFLENRGIEVSDISLALIVLPTDCALGNGKTRVRHRYNFKGRVNSTPMQGYLCYGGLHKARIHLR